MRFKIASALIIITCICCMSFIQDGKKKIVFFGDSITELGVKKGGYIDLLNNRIASNGQTNQFELLGAGIGGNKIYDLSLRLERDVLDKSPDVVVIWVGVNDGLVVGAGGHVVFAYWAGARQPSAPQD